MVARLDCTLGGRKGLVLGITNAHSIAYGGAARRAESFQTIKTASAPDRRAIKLRAAGSRSRQPNT
jgi:enoyl-[acyl-carrier-protein] reductase (NADH)